MTIDERRAAERSEAQKKKNGASGELKFMKIIERVLENFQARAERSSA